MFRMRRSRLVLLVAVCSLSAIPRGVGSQEKLPAPSTAGPLVKIEKVGPATEPYRAGLASISARDSLILLSLLSSDLMEGRETGSRGYRLAAEYAASLFALWGIEPGGDKIEGAGRSYFQDVVMKDYSGLDCTADWREGDRAGGTARSFKEHVDLENYYVNRVPETISGAVVFAGYGIREASIGYDDFAGVDVGGKIVMILDEVPGAGDPASPFETPELVQKYGAYAKWVGRLAKANAVAKLGPKAVLVVRNTLDGRDIYGEMGRVEDDERPVIDEPTRLVVLPGTTRGGGAICITREMADAILSASGQSVEGLKAKIAARWRPASFEIGGGTLTLRTTAGSERLIHAVNIIGLVQGSDPSLKGEAVVAGAHLDHLGKRGPYVFNGADDNASGVAGVLQIARAVSGLPRKPKRTTVFCLWTAEEMNLLGSTFYVRHPAFPLTRTLAYLNLDMIGRNSDAAAWSGRLSRLRVPSGERAGLVPGNFAAVAFTSGHGLGDALRAADRAVGLDLWPVEEAAPKSSGTVSDYLPFGLAGVPYLAWDGPRHADYHETGDSAAKIDGEGMAKIVGLAYLTMAELADR